MTSQVRRTKISGRLERKYNMQQEGYENCTRRIQAKGDYPGCKMRHCEERTTQFRGKKDCLNAIKKDCLRRTSDGMPVAEEC